MSDFVNTADVIGDDALSDQILTRTVTEFKSDGVKKIGKYALARCKLLTTIDCPNVETVAEYAFDECTAIANVNLPRVTDMKCGFASSQITSIELPELITGGDRLFYGCRLLPSISLPKLKTVKYRAFAFCPILTSVYLPELQVSEQELFSSSSQLETLDLPSLTNAGSQYSFAYLRKLTHINVPKLTSITSSAFTDCSVLPELDLPSVTSIEKNAFQNCSTLTKIILRSEVLCTLSNINAFKGTPFASGGTGGTVYVPQALISSYQTATNWSTLYAEGTCNFVSLEGSEYE